MPPWLWPTRSTGSCGPIPARAIACSMPAAYVVSAPDDQPEVGGEVTDVAVGVPGGRGQVVGAGQVDDVTHAAVGRVQGLHLDRALVAGWSRATGRRSPPGGASARQVGGRHRPERTARSGRRRTTGAPSGPYQTGQVGGRVARGRVERREAEHPGQQRQPRPASRRAGHRCRRRRAAPAGCASTHSSSRSPRRRPRRAAGRCARPGAAPAPRQDARRRGRRAGDARPRGRRRSRAPRRTTRPAGRSRRTRDGGADQQRVRLEGSEAARGPRDARRSPRRPAPRPRRRSPATAAPTPGDRGRAAPGRRRAPAAHPVTGRVEPVGERPDGGVRRGHPGDAAGDPGDRRGAARSSSAHGRPARGLAAEVARPTAFDPDHRPGRRGRRRVRGEGVPAVADSTQLTHPIRRPCAGAPPAAREPPAAGVGAARRQPVEDRRPSRRHAARRTGRRGRAPGGAGADQEVPRQRR